MMMFSILRWFRQFERLSGMQVFSLLWAGQFVSLIGTAMTRFALLIWAYQQTGEATTLALLGFFSFILYVAFSPIAGVVVDRLDRRLILLVTDLGAGLMTGLMLLLYSTGQLQIWHLYLLEALTGAFEAFQVPAYHASVSVLVPPRQYARANGLRALAQSATNVLSPFLAGLVLQVADLSAVMLIDLATFGAAWITLLLVRIPRPQRSDSAEEARGSLSHEMRFGFRYIRQRPGLLGLMLIFTGITFIAALTYYGVMPAMILARTSGDELALATVRGGLGIAGVAGGLLVSTVGLPRRRVHAALGFAAASFLLGDFLFAVGRTLPVWTFAALVAEFFVPFIVSAERSIWQVKVPPDVQGRVFAVQNMLRNAAMPLAYLVAGPLADRLFEPAMQPGGVLANVFGGLVGTGPGAGMGLMFLCTSILGMTICLLGYAIPAVRRVEHDLPDHTPEAVALEAA
ncbi:MAG: MFS transporter [Anaerolineae bacterium]|nr:MFS transporter [Anaerolineae bacterium]